ncbi:hypothetical protein [Rubrobacter tropicus]|nr:hypothetical protein [Rubrobacter tropicus]
MERVPGIAALSEAAMAKTSDALEATPAHLISVESAIPFSGRRHAPKTEA